MMNTMKLNGIHTLILFIGLVLSLVACNKNSPVPEDNPQEQRLELLSKTWNIENGSIRLDGADVSANYQGFKITFRDGNFSTEGAGELFPTSGTWAWIDNAATMIKTGRGKEMNLVAINDSELVLSFYKSNENAVTGAVGNYEIKLNP